MLPLDVDGYLVAFVLVGSRDEHLPRVKPAVVRRSTSTTFNAQERGATGHGERRGDGTP